MTHNVTCLSRRIPRDRAIRFLAFVCLPLAYTVVTKPTSKNVRKQLFTIHYLLQAYLKYDRLAKALSLLSYYNADVSMALLP